MKHEFEVGRPGGPLAGGPVRLARQAEDAGGRSSRSRVAVGTPLTARVRTGLSLAVGLLLGAGCASPNVDPAKPKANTGYVDFYMGGTNELSWDIQDLERRRPVYSQFDPLEGSILRLAFVPGRHHLGVAFLNRVVLQPASVEVEVSNGLVTPVQVRLVKSGTALVTRKDTYRGSTIYGRWGRSTKIRTDTDAIFRVESEVQPAVPYRTKAQMPYAGADGK